MSSELLRLYKEIPSFKCKPGCSDCCGPVPLAKEELRSLKKARLTDNGCTTCGFLVNGKCSVYDKRPFLCRLFGATADAAMRCPHGLGPEKPLSEFQTKLLLGRYLKLVGAAPAGYTVDIEPDLQAASVGPIAKQP